jgi:hypothetical protein
MILQYVVRWIVLTQVKFLFNILFLLKIVKCQLKVLLRVDDKLEKLNFL